MSQEVKDVLPFSNDAEKAVLGAALRDPNALMLIEGALISDHFFVDAHRKIFDAITSLSGAGEAADIVTVAEKLRGEKGDKHYLGPVYLVDLTESAPVAENIEYYAAIVRENFYIRKIILACQSTVKKARSSQGSIEGFIEEVEKEFLEISASYDRDGLVKADKVLEETINEIQRKIESDGTTSGIPTGFNDLDSLTGGLQPSDLIILAARPGMGKTALVLNLATHAALNERSVAFFTLEMSKEQLMSRVLSSVARVDSSRLVKGDLSHEELDRLMEGARRIFTVKDYLAIDETPGISLMELRSRCRRFQKENGLELVIIDYLQLMSGDAGGQDSREREISKGSRKGTQDSGHCIGTAQPWP